MQGIQRKQGVPLGLLARFKVWDWQFNCSFGNVRMFYLNWGLVTLKPGLQPWHLLPFICLIPQFTTPWSHSISHHFGFTQCLSVATYKGLHSSSSILLLPAFSWYLSCQILLHPPVSQSPLCAQQQFSRSQSRADAVAIFFGKHSVWTKISQLSPRYPNYGEQQYPANPSSLPWDPFIFNKIITGRRNKRKR